MHDGLKHGVIVVIFCVTLWAKPLENRRRHLHGCCSETSYSVFLYRINHQLLVSKSTLNSRESQSKRQPKHNKAKSTRRKGTKQRNKYKKQQHEMEKKTPSLAKSA